MASSIRPTRESSTRIRVAPEEVTIDDWPLRDRPLSSSLALTLAAGASWLAVWATGIPAAGAVMAGIFALTLWRTWLPVRYQLGSGGVVRSLLGWRRRIAWMSIRRHELRSDGVLLFPDGADTPLAPLRALYVHWSAQREAVIAQLDFYLLGRSRAPAASNRGDARGEAGQPNSAR
jgi:hypothetical protein